LRGLAATLGVDRLAAAAGEAEQRLLDADGADACARAVTAAAEAAAPGIAELVAALTALAMASGPPAGAPATPSFDPVLLRERIAQLADLVNSSDMAALDDMTQLRDQFGAGLRGPLRTALAALDSAVSALDFELAARLCQGALAALAEMPAPELTR
jgi:HPt (histidine-containing phosphotransfer) domain-containing protein